MGRDGHLVDDLVGIFAFEQILPRARAVKFHLDARDGETLIDEGVVGTQQIQHIAIFTENAFKKQFSLF